MASGTASTSWPERSLAPTGVYIIELRALNSARCELSPEFVELDPNTAYFGEGWDDPPRNRSCDAACEAIPAAIRRHYRVWPNWTEVAPH